MLRTRLRIKVFAGNAKCSGGGAGGRRGGDESPLVGIEPNFLEK